MTRRFILTTTLALTTLVAAAWGQPQMHNGGNSGGGGSSRRLNFLAGYLSLTDAQKTAAQAIFDAADTAVSTAAGQMTAAQTALRTAIKAGAADAELDRLAAAIGVIQGQIAAVNAKAESKFYALLTAEQKAKYDERGAGGGRGPGGFGRRPGSN